MDVPANKSSQIRPFIAWLSVIFFTLATGFAGRAQTIEDALDTTNLVWTTGGDAVWVAQTTNTYDGVDAVRSGVVYSNQTSWIETTVAGPATISFWSFVQTDFSLRFSFAQQFTTNNSGPPFLIQPILNFFGWNEQIYDLGAGTNVLRWTTSGLEAGSEAGFVCLDDFAVSPPRPLAIQGQPVDSTAYTGDQVWLFASAIGTPPINFQWYKNGTNIDGATNGELTLTMVTTNDNGYYSVVATNSQGQVSSSNALVTILPPTAPFFTYEPDATTAYTGQSLQLSTSVSGSPPFVYQWQKNNTNLLGANDSWLSFTNISLADAGDYMLLVTNAYGDVASSNITLTVISSIAPVITRQPRSLEVATGVNTWLTLVATGTPGPWFDWNQVGTLPPVVVPFPPAPVIGNPNPTRFFNNVTTNDAGVYFSTVNNYAGNVTSEEALLTVLPAITNVSSWAEDALDIVVTNQLAFLARGTNGLAILDVSNPAVPQLVGMFTTSNYVQKISVASGLVFIAEGSAGLEIVNVTNPANPVLAGVFHTPNYASDVIVRSNLAYVAEYHNGLVILDVSDTSAPSIVGSLSTNFDGYNISLSGKYAIVSSPFTGGFPNQNTPDLHIIDVSSPTHPIEVGSLPLAVGHLAIRDQCIFGIVNDSLDIVTITNPAQPVVIGTFSSYRITTTNTLAFLTLSASDVRVVNDYAFIIGNAGGQSRFFVLDVRDPTQPIPVGYYTSSGQPTALAVAGNSVFFAGDQSPLEIVGTPFDTSPVPMPNLSASAQSGMTLHLQGHRGLHYTVECADQLIGVPWQSLQTFLLTNDSAVIQVPTGSSAKFFRLKQLD